MYEKKGQMGASNLTAIGLSVGITIVIIVFMGLFAGSIFNSLESDITDITNVTIENSVITSSESAFDALEQFSDLLPIVVLAIMFAVALGIIVGSLYIGRVSGGSAL